MGGLKYGGRLDVLPLGEFKSGNDGVGADFVREESPKLLVGGAMSYNAVSYTHLNNAKT